MGDAYSSWNDALACRFFGANQAGKPAYLTVDDDELATLAPSVDAALKPEEGVSAFAAAVRGGLTAQLPGTGIFSRYLNQATTWRQLGSKGDPPYIGLLGLCVLAASHMASDPEEGITSGNYYRRLGELLQRDDGGIPPGFEAVRMLWGDLKHWLTADMHGSRGVSTVQGHRVFTNIGYPMSQCLLAERDRRRLTHFFRAVGLEPHESISEEELSTLFSAWVHPDCGLSGNALRLLAKATADVRSQLAAIVFAEFAEWEGEFRDVRGRERGEIVLQLKLMHGGHHVEMRFVPRRPAGFPDGEFRRQPGMGAVALFAAGDDWYQPLETPVDSSTLGAAIELENGGHVLTYEPRPVIAFRPNFEIGGFASVSQAAPLEPHCIAVHAAKAEAVERFLRDVARPGWRTLPESAGLPRGWRLLRDVVFEKPGVPEDPALRCLAPRFATRLRLEGGLEVARDTYLVHEEPGVWISLETEALAAIDDHSRHVDAGGTMLDLREFELAEGSHTLSVAGQTRRFRTIPGFPVVSSAASGTLGLVLKRHSDYRAEAPGPVPLPDRKPSRGEVFISGANVVGDPEDLPVETFPPVLLWTGSREYVLLGAVAGQVMELQPPPMPKWLERAGIVGYQYFDQPCPFACQWAILYGSEGCRLRALEAAPAPAIEILAVPSMERYTWATVIAAAEANDVRVSENVASIWARYVEVAGEILGR